MATLTVRRESFPGLSGLCSTYVVGEVFETRDSLHWRPGQAPLFSAVYAALVLISAVVVLLHRRWKLCRGPS